MAPHTWSYLGDTASDATHRMYYRGQRIKEAYYRGEKIWGEEPLTQFRVKTSYVKDKYPSRYAQVLQVNFSGANLQYSIDGTETVTVEANEEGLTNAVIIPYQKKVSEPNHIVTFFGIDALSHIDFKYSCGLTEVMDPFPTMSMITSMTDCFRYCTRLTDIPESLFWKNEQIADFDFTFSGTEVGYTLTDDVFIKNTNVTRFFGTFENATFPYGIPEGLFSANRLVGSFEECFAYAKIETYDVPENLFKNNTEATDFIITFAASTLKYPPANLFRYNVKARSFFGCFCESSVEDVPSTLFSRCTLAEEFGACFSKAESLTNIPSALFRYNARAESFCSCFYYCHNLESIPNYLFAYNKKAYDFDSTFGLCQNITNIPNNLFCTTSEHFYDGKMTLAHCFESSGLTSIPSSFYSWLRRIKAVTLMSERRWYDDEYKYYIDGKAMMAHRHYCQFEDNDRPFKPRYANMADSYAQFITRADNGVSGSFVGMFNRCFNLEGTIPAIWDESEFYGSASQYAPKNLPDFDTEHTYYDDEGGTVGHSEYYINGKGARVGDETAVQHFKNGYLLASGCFNGCWKLDNFYDIPVTWLATNALSVVYYTEIE